MSRKITVNCERRCCALQNLGEYAGLQKFDPPIEQRVITHFCKHCGQLFYLKREDPGTTIEHVPYRPGRPLPEE